MNPRIFRHALRACTTAREPVTYFRRVAPGNRFDPAEGTVLQHAWCEDPEQAGVPPALSSERVAFHVEQQSLDAAGVTQGPKREDVIQREDTTRWSVDRVSKQLRGLLWVFYCTRERA